MRIDFGGFLTHLDGLTDSPQTIKTLKSGFRRATRDLDDDDMQNPVIVRQYRDSLKQGTRNVFDNVWKHLRAFTNDGIARPDRLPYVKYAHPLHADMAYLHARYGDALPTKTWADLDGEFESDVVYRHAVRCHRFIAGDRSLSPGDPLVPKDAAMNPMPTWLVRYIVNSTDTCGTYEACDLFNDFASRLSLTDLPEAFLRDGCNRIVGARNALSHTQMARVRKDLKAAFDQGKLEVVRWIVEQLPQSVDPELTQNEIMW